MKIGKFIISIFKMSWLKTIWNKCKRKKQVNNIGVFDVTDKMSWWQRFNHEHNWKEIMREPVEANITRFLKYESTEKAVVILSRCEGCNEEKAEYVTCDSRKNIEVDYVKEFIFGSHTKMVYNPSCTQGLEEYK